MLSEYVRERLRRLLAESLSRRPDPARTTAHGRATTVGAGEPSAAPESLDRPSHRLSTWSPADLGPPDDEGFGEDPLEDYPDPLPSVRESGAGPSSSSLHEADPRPDVVVEGWNSPRPRSRFSRAHVAVVSLLLVMGLLGAGWSVLRARPLAIASTPVAGSSGGGSSMGGTSKEATPSTTPDRTGANGRSTPPQVEIVVHVLGAVRRPGVVTLPDRSRVRDALRAAGGLAANADPKDLNLAQVLADGEQLVIGTTRRPAGEVRQQSSGVTRGSTEQGKSGAQLVDLNRATGIQLEDLPGVGPVTAAKIVAWRVEHTRFSRVEELQEVDGIGPKTFADIAPHVRV